MAPHPAAGDNNTRADFEQFQPEGIDTSRCRFGAVQCATQAVERRVGKSMEQEPELVGNKPVRTEAVSTRVQFQLLDHLILDLPATNVEVIERECFAAEAGEHEAIVDALGTDFGIHEDATVSSPRPGP